MSGINRMKDLLSKHPDVTGLVCNGDMVALGACHTLQINGYIPGKEISVIGFDDVLDASLATPSLTTMAIKPYRLGQLLAETIIKRITYHELAPFEHLKDAELIVRDTTGTVNAR